MWLVVTARRLDSSIMWLLDLMSPKKYDTVLEAVRQLCGYSSSSNKYRIPSLALKLGHSLKKCCNIMICNCVKRDDKVKRKQLEAFHFLCEKEWTAEVSSAALSTLSTAQMNKPQLLPLTVSIQKLNNYLNQERTRLQEQLQSSTSVESWYELAKVTLTATILFNRKRAGEAERMLLTDYYKRNVNQLEANDIALCLSDTEKLLCKMMSRIEVRENVAERYLLS